MFNNGNKESSIKINVNKCDSNDNIILLKEFKQFKKLI